MKNLFIKNENISILEMQTTDKNCLQHTHIYDHWKDYCMLE